jgi:hypothetical protein
MRQNPDLDIATAITELAVGEALLSFLDEKARPSVTQRAYVLPPASQIGPISTAQRQQLLDNSLVVGVYEKTVDRESAFEALKGRAQTRQAEAAKPPASSTTSVPAGAEAAPASAGGGILGSLGDLLGGGAGHRRTSVTEQLFKSAASSIGREVGHQIIRGVLGGIFGGRR